MKSSIEIRRFRPDQIIQLLSEEAVHHLQEQINEEWDAYRTEQGEQFEEGDLAEKWEDFASEERAKYEEEIALQWKEKASEFLKEFEKELAEKWSDSIEPEHWQKYAVEALDSGDLVFDGDSIVC